ncbi:MBL fold metallo-hydrolase [Altericista sp. CCNU0014]|uniref:MBL fold metallo-hydrolase n=1 Tax=Altericista sp. CCNU0014 TaxID=3082949 RepID=UPI003850E53A
MPQLKLSEKFRWYPVYEDTTRFGSAVTNRCDASVRNACADIVAYRQARGLSSVVAHTRELLNAAMSDGLVEFYERPGILHRDWLYPHPPSVQPAALAVEDEMGQAIARIPLSAELLPDLAGYLGEWSQGAAPPSQPSALNLWNALIDLGAFAEAVPPIAPFPGNATFVGHSTVCIQSAAARIWVDPFLLPKSSQYPKTYQPLGLSELGQPDAVFITHSHPDHYDLASLLRLGADTPIYVPDVRRESVLAIDMAFRLRQLGFRQVRTLAWYEEATVKDLRAIALPFYGEQPTVFHALHPEVRNAGNTYLFEWGDRRIALAADSGQDGQGNIKALAAEALQRYGVLDVLFGGFRGFALYPIQYLFSSVARYLTFVPPSLWSVRQQMMCDADDLLDVGEIWQTQTIIPYSDGGAPWYWLRGLGPALDGSSPAILAVDPTPAHLVEVAARRSGTIQDGAIASPVLLEFLYPGDSLAWTQNGMDVLRPQCWPYGTQPSHQTRANP